MFLLQRFEDVGQDFESRNVESQKYFVAPPGIPREKINSTFWRKKGARDHPCDVILRTSCESDIVLSELFLLFALASSFDIENLIVKIAIYHITLPMYNRSNISMYKV